MRAACIRALLPFGLLSGWLGTAFPAAALGVPEQSPAVFEHLTTADGLPQSTVYTTLQDSQGFVWLGTEDGLVH
jgi:ligand-binding sensor domain-containing protein